MPFVRPGRLRPTPSMIVALLALFVALGGPAQAAHLIDGRSIRKNTITSRQIKDGSIAKRDLSPAAVRALQATPANSVRAPQLANGQVTAPKLAVGAVGATQLSPGAVSASKVAKDAIGGSAIADGSLQTVDIGSFTGAIQVDFNAFAPGDCQVVDVAAQSAGGGQPNIADDVVAITPAAGWPDPLVVTGKPAPGNHIRLVACYVAPQGAAPIDPGATIFRYVTFDSP